VSPKVKRELNNALLFIFCKDLNSYKNTYEATDQLILTTYLYVYLNFIFIFATRNEFLLLINAYDYFILCFCNDFGNF